MYFGLKVVQTYCRYFGATAYAIGYIDPLRRLVAVPQHIREPEGEMLLLIRACLFRGSGFIGDIYIYIYIYVQHIYLHTVRGPRVKGLHTV